MATETTNKSKRRENILLILVALVGVAGLLVLQFARKSPSAGLDDKSQVQISGTQAEDPNAGKPIQKVPGNLVRENEQPEALKPFLFEMTNFAKGATYELDPGDGSGRKAFADGILKHTYYKHGAFEVTLYALYEGQEVKLQTVTKRVAPAAKKEEVAPAIDF